MPLSGEERMIRRMSTVGRPEQGFLLQKHVPMSNGEANDGNAHLLLLQKS